RSLDSHVARLGVRPDDIVAVRFLARMVVAGSMPRAETGGVAGRPRVTDSGHPGVLIAGDWVGPDGLLADASLASGHDAARRALVALDRGPVLVACTRRRRARSSRPNGLACSASPTGWWARSPTPRTSCRKPGCAGAP